MKKIPEFHIILHKIFKASAARNRAAAALILLCCAAPAWAGTAQQEPRLVWWQDYEAKLKQERQMMAGSPAAAGALDRELASAAKVISVWKAAGENPESLITDEDELTEASLEKQIRKFRYIPAAEAAGTLLSGGPADREFVRGLVEKELNSMITEAFTGDRKGLADAILAEDISSAEWQAMEKEVWPEQVRAAWSAYTGKLETAVSSALKSKDHPVWKTSLQPERDALIKKEFLSAAEKISFSSCFGSLEGLAEKTRTWHEIRERTERDFRMYSMILNKNPMGKRLPVPRLRYYKQQLSAFDMLMFPEEKAVSGPSFTPDPGTDEKGIFKLPVPSMPDPDRIRTGLDELRRTGLKRISSACEEGYLKALDREMTALIRKECGPARKVFDYGHVLLSKKKKEISDALNGKTFVEGEAELDRISGEADDYRRRSMDFLRETEACLKPSPGAVENIFESGLSFGRKRADFAAELARMAADCRLADEEKKQQDKLLKKLIAYTASLEEWGIPDNRFLHAAGRDGAGKLKKAGSEYRGEIRAVRGSMPAESGAAMPGDASKRASLTAAEYELMEIWNSLDDWSSVITKTDYDRGAFERYGETYSRLADDAASGNLTPELKKVLEKGSLFDAVRDFDPVKVSAASEERKFCRAKIRALSGRLRAVSRWHRRAGRPVEYFPDEQELAAAEAAALKEPSVRAGSHIMTGENFKNTDKKAAAELRRTADSALWRQPAEVSVQAGINEQTVSAEGLTVKMSIPAGWTRAEKVSSFDGTAAVFYSPDGKARFRVVILDTEEDADSVGWSMAGAGGMAPLSGRRGSSGAGDYFYCSGRSSRTVREVYVFKAGNRTAVLEGETDRARYSLFTAKLGKVADTVRTAE